MESELARVQNTENHIMQQDIESTVVDVKEIMQDSCQVLTAAAISPSRVICTGWAVAASPTARATVKNFYEAENMRNQINMRPMVKTTPLLVSAAGKVVYRLRTVYDDGSSSDVYRRWSEIEALVGALRGLGNPEIKAATDDFKYKYTAVTFYDAAYGELRCDGQRIEKRCGLISALLAALERVDGGLGTQKWQNGPLVDFLSAPVPLPSSADIELVSQDRMAEALSSAKAVLASTGPRPLANQIVQQHHIESTVADDTEIMQDSRVICTGWAVAASPTARATVKNFYEAHPVSSGPIWARKQTAENNLLPMARPTSSVFPVRTAAGEVVYRLRVVYDDGGGDDLARRPSSIDVYRRWSEIEALVDALRVLGTPEFKAATDDFKSANPRTVTAVAVGFAAAVAAATAAVATADATGAFYNAAYGELHCDGQRIEKRCEQISALFETPWVRNTLGVVPLLDFLSAPVPLPSSTGFDQVSQDRMAEALSSAKAVLASTGPRPLARAVDTTAAFA
jgi:hypothetical protein